MPFSRLVAAADGVSGRPHAKLGARGNVTAPRLPVGADPVVVARLLAAILRFRVEHGTGPSFSACARALGYPTGSEEFVTLMRELKRLRLVDFSRERGSLKMADRIGLAEWTLRTLANRDAEVAP